MKSLSFILLLCLIIFGCNKTETQSTPVDFSGNWVSTDYIDHISANKSPKKVMQDIAFYITEMVVNKARFKDSIVVYNGQKESAHLPFSRVGDTLKLKLNGDLLTSIYLEDSMMVFKDSKLNRVFRFRKALKSEIDPSYEMPLSFPTIVNAQILAGTYDFFENQGKQRIVQFTTKGQIKGWDAYDNYQIMINGDEVENFSSDLLVCQKGVERSKYFAFDASKKDTIVIHNVNMLSAQDQPLKLEKSTIQALLIKRK